MAETKMNPEEAITEEEIFNQDAPRKKPKVVNAFQQLMSPNKPKQQQVQKPERSTGGNPFKNRMGLGAYLDDPASFPASIVIAHDDDFVVIHDKFPKATVHTLILPRSSKYNLKHPFDAFDDPELLAKVKAQVKTVKSMVAAELQRKLGSYSEAERDRQAVLDGKVDLQPGQDLPKGRDWTKEIKVGVHAVPSMTHLHVHVLSRDMHSESLKHRKHYNSFVTEFLVDIEDFPLPQDDPRRRTKEEGYLARDLCCWRCGKNFGAQFKRLKEHLDGEFDKWKRE